MGEESQRDQDWKVRSLIEKATNSTAPEVDPRLLKSIKWAVRSSHSELRLAVETLMEKMKKDHSQILRSKNELLLDAMEEDEVEEFRCPALQQIRLDSLKEGQKVHESNDNKAVFDVLKAVA